MRFSFLIIILSIYLQYQLCATWSLCQVDTPGGGIVTAATIGWEQKSSNIDLRPGSDACALLSWFPVSTTLQKTLKLISSLIYLCFLFIQFFQLWDCNLQFAATNTFIKNGRSHSKRSLWLRKTEIRQGPERKSHDIEACNPAMPKLIQ